MRTGGLRGHVCSLARGLADGYVRGSRSKPLGRQMVHLVLCVGTATPLSPRSPGRALWMEEAVAR